MAEQIPAAVEATSWNPALRPDTTPDASVAASGGGHSRVLDEDNSREAPASHLKSPLGDGDFSAWDTPPESNLDNEEIEVQGSESSTERTLTEDNKSVLETTSPVLPADVVEIVQPQPTQDPSATAARDGISDAHSSPILEGNDHAHISSDERQTFRSSDDTKEDIQGTEFEENMLPAQSSVAAQPTISTEVESLQSDNSRHPGEDTAESVQPTPSAVDQPKAAPVQSTGNNIEKELTTDEISRPSETEHTDTEATGTEKVMNGHVSWVNEAKHDADSDDDDFFNQLKTQTKPIFAPPESESRFEEGVPLLDDTTPLSPPRVVPPRKAADNLFGNDEDEGEDFFGAIHQRETNVETPHHITRKSTSQVLGPTQPGVDSPSTDNSAAAQLGNILNVPAAEISQTSEEQGNVSGPSEEELAARWEAELSDTGDDDLAAKWEAALDDDDMLLEDDSAPMDSAGYTGLKSPFETPQSNTRTRPASSAYTPHQPTTADLLQGVSQPASVPSYFSQQPQNPVATRGESFAERSKEGYKSPYDLPEDLSRPRRPLATAKPISPKIESHVPPPPPREAGALSTPASSTLPPASSTVPPVPTAPPPAPKNFFEELPLPPVRACQGSSGRYTPGPCVEAPPEPPVVSPPQKYGPDPAPIPSMVVPAQSSLQTPDQLDPYSATLGLSAPTGPSPASRYSPKPPGPQSPSKPSSVPRYSPAPPPAASPTRNRYASQPLGVPGQQTALPFQPRTSSPLAYHEKVSYQPEEPHQAPPPSLQPSVTLSPPRVQRSPVDDGLLQASQAINVPAYGGHGEGASLPAAPRQASPPTSRYAPPEYLNEFAKRVTPNTNYAPHVSAAAAPISPPVSESQTALPRSQTQSPGQQMTSPRAAVPPLQTLPRPASVHGSSSPTKTTNPYAPTQSSMQTRARALSRGLEFVSPTDGQELDPLQRWKGAPIFKFGFGGTVVSCFPRHTPRYSAGQATPLIMAGPGEPKFSQIGEWLPTTETLVQHPGPLKSKSKKKDVLAWLSSKIAAFDNEPSPGFDWPQAGHQTRHEEKVLLWKVIKILVENDGVLEGSPAIQNSLRQALFPNTPEAGPGGAYGAAFAPPAGFAPLNVSSQPDSVEPQSIEELRSYLLQGDREKATWKAVDRRLWGHALIIASTLDRSVWKQVVQEFVRREIRSTTTNWQSLAALYEIFAGNIEESIDELVPPSARAGHQMISKADGHDATKNALDGLNSWKDTVGLVLSNRSSEDHQALFALGRLLASYGRTEAAHICFILSRATVFGCADDPQAGIVLLGVDHQHGPSVLMNEDAFLLTEIYEYATSVLANAPTATLPYLSAFKVLHAQQLADRGRKTEAQNYCEAVASSLKATTRPSPYHHQHLYVEVDEFLARLRQNATDGGSSWITRPSMEKVSGSMWARFNSFVAGDDGDAASTGSGKAGETADFGPFAHVAGTPTVSRSPSVSDMYGSYPGAGAPGAQPVPTGGSSRYMPSSNQYAPNASPEQYRGRSSLDSQRSTSFGGLQFGQRRSSLDQPSPPVDSHMFQNPPMYGSPGAAGYQSTPPQSSYMPLAPVEEDASIHTQSPAEVTPSMQPPVNGLFYQPSTQDAATASQSPYYQGPPGMPQSASSGYMPPPTAASYEPSATGNAYAPPSYVPEANGEAASEETEKLNEHQEQPRKKAFMDDDDDDDLAKRAAAIQKAENDRKADEAFRKAAEEDGK